MSNKYYSIGLDIGGTKMLGVLWDGSRVVAEYQLATPKDNLEHFLVMAQAVAEPLIAHARENKGKVEGLGLGVAAVIDHEKQVALDAPNIPIINMCPLARRLSERLDLPVIMDNDANAFIRAEALMGAGRTYSSIYGIIIGTGIGGAWWHRGEVFRGMTGGAGEPGEMIIDFADNTRLEPAYHQLTQNNPAQLAEEAFRGDILADKVFAEVGEMLGKALANITNLIEPEIFILGGGVVNSGSLFLPSAKKAMKDNIYSATAKKRTKIHLGKLGPQAGAIGAALLIDQK